MPSRKQAPADYDGSKPHNDPSWERFCQEYVLSGNATDAWRKATGKTKNADVSGPFLLGKVGIQKRIAGIRAETASASKIDKEWLVNFYSRILLARPDEASADSDICETTMTKAGPFTALCSKMTAAQRLAEMCGFNAPQQVEHSGSIAFRDRLMTIREKGKA